MLALIGVALGVSNRKDGKLAELRARHRRRLRLLHPALLGARGGVRADGCPPSFAPWLVNLVLGVAGVGARVLARRRRPISRFASASRAFWRAPRRGAAPAAGGAARAARGGRVVLVVRDSARRLAAAAACSISTSSRQYLSVFLLAFVALVGIFYISTFIDLADKLFGGVATTRLLLRYFYFATPQFVYYIIPMAALVATLVTIGLLTKNSELIVMRACGISLYRSALPLLLFARRCSAARCSSCRSRCSPTRTAKRRG